MSARNRNRTLTVILVTHNSEKVLGGFLESLPAACGGLDWNLVVADNASTDESVAAVRAAMPDALVVPTGANLGYAAGINLAVEAAPPTEFLLITNPDIRAPAGSVASLVDSFTPGIGILGPRIVDESGALSLSLHRDPTVSRALSDAVVGGERIRRWRGESINGAQEYDVASDVDWLSGAFLVVSRQCHDQLGGWDPRFFLYSEEADFALRARDRGWRVRYDPSCSVVHVGGESATSPELFSMLTVNRIRLVRMRRGRAYGAVFAAAVLLGEIVRSVRSREPAVHRAAVTALVRPAGRPPQVAPTSNPVRRTCRARKESCELVELVRQPLVPSEVGTSETRRARLFRSSCDDRRGRSSRGGLGFGPQ